MADEVNSGEAQANGAPAGETPQAAPAKAKKKKSPLRIVLYVILGIVAVRVLLSIPMNIPRGPQDSDKMIFPPKAIVYNGPGELHAYLETEIPAGTAVKKFDRCKSEILGQSRDVIVRVPKGSQDAKEPLPLVVVFHGYLDRPQHMALSFIEAFDAAQQSGNAPPVVLAFPDLSIGGTGEDDPKTPNLDERLGTWGVNSNLGRYEDFLVTELLPWLRKTYNCGADAQNTVFAGFSAGGFIATGLTLKHPDLDLTAVSFSGTLDARYSVNNSHLTPYNPVGYKPVAEDWPNRPMLRAGLFGTYTDSWAFWPVFDSDKNDGPVWKKDIPVWQRLRAENPTDLARKPDLNLAGHAFYLVAGDRDNFNFQSHLPIITELLKARGADVAPPDPVRPGAHSIEFVHDQIPDAAAWIGARLRAFRGETAPAPAAPPAAPTAATPAPPAK